MYRLFPYGYQRLSKGKYPEGWEDGDPSNTYDVRIEIGVPGKKDKERLEEEEAPLVNKSGVLLIPRYVACMSPYLERGIQGQEGKYLRPVNGGELQIVLNDSNGFLTVEAFAAIVDVLVGYTDLKTAHLNSPLMFSIYVMSQLLELDQITETAKNVILTRVDQPTVAITAWMAKQNMKQKVLDRCYWFLKDILLGQSVPLGWHIDEGERKSGWMTMPGALGQKKEAKEEILPDVVIKKGSIFYKSLETPFSNFIAEMEENVRDKMQFATATEGYTLCRIRRYRVGDGKDVSVARDSQNADEPQTYQTRTDLLVDDDDSPAGAFSKAFQKTVDWPHIFEMSAEQYPDHPILVAIKYEENAPYFVYSPPWPENDADAEDRAERRAMAQYEQERRDYENQQQAEQYQRDPYSNPNFHDQQYEQHAQQQQQQYDQYHQQGGSVASEPQFSPQERLAAMRKRLLKLTQYQREFVGVVEPNFWGTEFTFYDEGVDETVLNSRPAVTANNFPYMQRKPVLTASFEANLLGDQPRKVTLQLDEKVHTSESPGKKFGDAPPPMKMKSVKPVWDDQTQAFDNKICIFLSTSYFI
mgnify:CR=1 FL=1